MNINVKIILLTFCLTHYATALLSSEQQTPLRSNREKESRDSVYITEKIAQAEQVAHETKALLKQLQPDAIVSQQHINAKLAETDARLQQIKEVQERRAAFYTIYNSLKKPSFRNCINHFFVWLGIGKTYTQKTIDKISTLLLPKYQTAITSLCSPLYTHAQAQQLSKKEASLYSPETTLKSFNNAFNNHFSRLKDLQTIAQLAYNNNETQAALTALQTSATAMHNACDTTDSQSENSDPKESTNDEIAEDNELPHDYTGVLLACTHEDINLLSRQLSKKHFQTQQKINLITILHQKKFGSQEPTQSSMQQTFDFISKSHYKFLKTLLKPDLTPVYTKQHARALCNQIIINNYMPDINKVIAMQTTLNTLLADPEVQESFKKKPAVEMTAEAAEYEAQEKKRLEYLSTTLD